MTFLEAAVAILQSEARPLHYKRLTELAIKHQMLSHVGRTPEEAMQAQLQNAVRRKNEPHGLVRTQPGTFGLKQYPAEGERPPLPEPAAPEPTPKKKAPAAKAEAPGARAKKAKAPEAKVEAKRGKARKGKAAPEEVAPAEEVVGAAEEVSAPSEPAGDEGGGEAPGEHSGTPRAEAALAVEGEPRRKRRRRRGGRGRRRRGPDGAPLPPGEGQAPPSGAHANGVSVDPEHDHEEDEDENGEALDDAIAVAADQLPAAEPVSALEAVPRTPEAHLAPRPAAPVERPAVEGSPASCPAAERPAAERPAAERLAAERPAADATADRDAGQGPRGDSARLADAAFEILRGLSTGRPMVASEIIHLAVRRGLLREMNDHGNALRIALFADNRTRAAAGLRPRFRVHGEGRFSLGARTLEPDLAGQERSLQERVDGLRREVRAAFRRRLQGLAPDRAASVLRVLLEAWGVRDWVPLRREDRTFIALGARARARERVVAWMVASSLDLPRRAVTDAREAVRANAATEAVVVTLGRIGADALAEASRGGAPVTLLDIDAIVEIAATHGIGIQRVAMAVELLDAEMFEGLAS